MVQVASFTSAGTPVGPRDTLAQLMAKKKILAQQQGDILAPRQIESWTQGAAQLAQTAVNALQQGSAASEESAGRAQMAAAMAGIDWTKGPSPEQLQTIAMLDPDTGQRIMEQSASRAMEELKYKRGIERSDFEFQRTQADQIADEARQAAQRATETGAAHEYETGKEATIDERERLQQIETEKRAAVTAEAKAKAEADAKKLGFITGDEAAARGGDPTKTYKASADGSTLEEVKPEAPLTEEGKLALALKRGEITQEVYDAAIKKETQPSGVGGPANLKVLYDQQDQYINTTSAIGQLKRAQSLIDQGIDWGNLAGVRTWTGSGGMMGEDAKALAQRTKDYNSIMNQEAIAAMSQALKGATTDTEMNRFIADMNDQAMDPKIKRQKIDVMLAKAQAFNEMQAARIKQMDPNSELPSVGAAKITPEMEADLLAGARAAISQGADAALVKKRLVDKGVDPGKL